MTQADNPQSGPLMDSRDVGDWPLRPWILAAGLGLVGLIVYLMTETGGGDEVAWRVGVAAAAVFAGLAAAFTVQEDRYTQPAIFAGIVGVIMGGIAWRAAEYGPSLPDEQFSIAAGILATAIAVPLFQAGFHRYRMATDYADTHYHGWTDAISGAGALAFTGLSWLIMFLLAGLFQLIEIDLLKVLIDEEWFGFIFSGAAFGAGLGVLRNQSKILGTLQHVVMLVFSLLAVPVAIGLGIFLIAVLVSGLDVLWRATDSATPFLLTFGAGAVLLVNAVVRDTDAESSASRVLRGAAAALAAMVFPLAVLAAISMGTRIAQHGFSPERIWAMIAIIVACVYGAAYLVSLILGRKADWRRRIRRSNMIMAVITFCAAVLLALPLMDAGAISARDQMSRLASGEVSAEDFDYHALRWDFGDAGREALAKLAKSENAEIAKLAKDAQSRENRYDRRGDKDSRDAANRAQVDVASDATERAVREFIRENRYFCGSTEDTCIVRQVGETEGSPLMVLLNNLRDPQYLSHDLKADTIREITVRNGTLVDEYAYHAYAVPQTGPNPQIELRPYTGRQLYIDGKPAGAPFK